MATALLGREQERGRIDALVSAVGECGGALVIVGDAGVGKSALVTEAARFAAARGLRVLAATGVESESHLPFAGLHQLLRPVLHHADELPQPQRDAILAAFGVRDAPAPDLFLIALATLNLLSDVATLAPVLTVLDDVQWLDSATQDVLAFVARRVESEPIAVVAALRDGFDCSFGVGLPTIRVEPLDEVSATAVLAQRAPGLAAPVRRLLLAQAAGNPLALVELPVRIDEVGRIDGIDQPGGAGGLAASVVSPAGLPLTVRLEQTFAARFGEMPAATRALLQVAAIDEGAPLAATLSAATSLAGDDVTAADALPAVDARLIDLTAGRLQFRHPLVRSAIHQGSTAVQRHRIHCALADALSGDPERQLWHRAACTAGTDESIAADLDAAAAQSIRRGAVSGAMEALQRAASLSLDPRQRTSRLLHAAELAVELGRHADVLRLITEVELVDLTFEHEAQVLGLRATYGLDNPDINAGPRKLADFAEQLGVQGNNDLALSLLWVAAVRCWMSQSDTATRLRVVAVTEHLTAAEHDPRRLGVLAYAAPLERGAVVIDQLRRTAANPGDDAHTLRHRGAAAITVGAFDLGLSLSAASLGYLRAQGRLGALGPALLAQAASAAHLVTLDTAIPAAEEAARLLRETSQPFLFAVAQATEAMVAALRGDDARAELLAAESERAVMAAGARSVLATVQHARALSALGAGRYADAYDHLRRLHDPADPAHHVLRCYSVGDLADAAVHSGRGAAIADIVAELEGYATQTPSPALHAGLRYARAVLADDDVAEALFVVALQAETGGWPFARARTQLAYGEWLRRQRRTADSRPPLRAARDTFDALGAIPWGERARQELRASGETSRRRTVDARDQLTPQELQIVQLAADGLTNREIGEKLYLSHRTISSHLHRIFPKLGVTSRSALADAIGRP